MRATRPRKSCSIAAGLGHDLGAAAYPTKLTARRAARIDALLERRIAERIPLAYLTHRSFFAGLELYVDERVLVPRSPIAELILQRFQPWVDARRVRRILDIGTGSGAIAAGMRRGLPRRTGGCGRRVAGRTAGGAPQSAPPEAGKARNGAASDYFDAVRGRRYDIIVSNPPYVGRAEMARLPREYRHEPRLGLAAGADGLDSVRAIFSEARQHLRRDGILVVEVGNTEDALLRTFPTLPFVWPEIAMGGGGVFLLRARDLIVHLKDKG